MPSYVTPMRKTGCSPPDDCSLLRSNSIDLVGGGALVEYVRYTHAARVGFQLTFSQSVAIGFSGAGAFSVQQRSSSKLLLNDYSSSYSRSMATRPPNKSNFAPCTFTFQLSPDRDTL